MISINKTHMIIPLIAYARLFTKIWAGVAQVWIVLDGETLHFQLCHEVLCLLGK